MLYKRVTKKSHFSAKALTGGWQIFVGPHQIHCIPLGPPLPHLLWQLLPPQDAGTDKGIGTPKYLGDWHAPIPAIHAAAKH